MKKYAGIIIDQAHPSIDQIFHYMIPDDLRDIVGIGFRVVVPFGRYNSHIDGYVMRLDDEVDLPEEKIKSIIEVKDSSPAILPQNIPLIEWMVSKYHCMTIEAIRCFVPKGLRSDMRKKKERVAYLTVDGNVDDYIDEIKRRSSYMARILDYLKDKKAGKVKTIAKATSAPDSSFRSLQKRGWIKIERKEIYRDPWQRAKPDSITIPKLTQEQQIITDKISKALDRGKYLSFLLHGVTGSGKTEVYIRAVEKVISAGGQAIVLVPEISLTPQTVGRFKNRFGDQVAVLHSRLSDGERYDEWRRIIRKEANIAIGARSAIFAPFPNLALVIIDEAHENSYKSDLRPKYHAIEIARKRCQIEGGVLILGTATPSVDEYFKALDGKNQLLELSQRVDGSELPPVEVVDMREELMLGNRSMFSGALYEGIETILRRRQQAILLLNRRGYANFISCRGCGWVAECSRCAVSLTYHVADRRLKCHYCGNQYLHPKICPKCKGKYIKQFGVGTQRLEKELRSFFPEAKIARMDMDTTSTKDAHENILSAFGRGEYDILLGTQMIAKGLDFPNVTLVGVIAADASLNLPEYTSPERTFQLITQVGGRAGRGSSAGKVIVQTYNPDHYAIEYAAAHDYKAFYNHEIRIRREFDYPPFANIIKILLTGTSEANLIDTAGELETWLEKHIKQSPLLEGGLIQIGSYPAPLSKIKDRYRWQLLLKIRDKKIFLNAYHELIDLLLRCYNISNETISIDFSPTSLL